MYYDQIYDSYCAFDKYKPTLSNWNNKCHHWVTDVLQSQKLEPEWYDWQMHCHQIYDRYCFSINTNQPVLKLLE